MQINKQTENKGQIQLAIFSAVIAPVMEQSPLRNNEYYYTLVIAIAKSSNFEAKPSS